MSCPPWFRDKLFRIMIILHLLVRVQYYYNNFTVDLIEDTLEKYGAPSALASFRHSSRFQVLAVSTGKLSLEIIVETKQSSLRL
jgi:hypothetical protein